MFLGVRLQFHLDHDRWLKLNLFKWEILILKNWIWLPHLWRLIRIMWSILMILADLTPASLEKVHSYKLLLSIELWENFFPTFNVTFLSFLMANMHFSLSAVNAFLLLCFLVKISEAIFTCGQRPKPIRIPDFDCDGQFITGASLNEVVSVVRCTANYKSILFEKERLKLKKFYSGPPFLDSYLLWPVSPETTSYEKGITKHVLCT